MVNKNIISKIDSYQKKKSKEISKLLNKKNNYTINFDENRDTITILLASKKIFTSSYYFFGIIQPSNNWIWASSIPGTSKKIINIVRKLKNMAYLFEDNNDKRMLFYHQFLTQDMIMLTDDIQIEWINKLLLYLSDGFYFLNPANKKNNLQFLVINKIYGRYS